MATIRRRTWANADGTTAERWQVDFADQEGRRRHKQFRRKKDADRYLIHARAAVEAGTYVPESTAQTIEQAAAAWIKRGQAERLERSTIRQRQTHIRHILAVIDPDIRLARISVTRLETARDELLTRLSRATARKVITSLRAILKQAKAVHLATADIAVKGASRHRKRLEAGVDFPTPAEVKTLVSTATGQSLALLSLAAFAGLRASELRGLRWSDVALGSHPTVTVAQRADRWQQIGSPKSAAAHRTVPLSATTVRALKAWRLEQPPGRPLVFGGKRGQPSDLATIHRLIAPVLAKAGLSYGLHALRHYAVSSWLAAALDLKLCQRWAGHATLALTLDTYGHFIPRRDDHEQIAAVERGLFG
jgi:integrase